jgi:hypothetical protein
MKKLKIIQIGKVKKINKSTKVRILAPEFTGEAKKGMGISRNVI